jgi:pimeloyl-ACP methyl ester carboxylesterase
MPDKPIMLFLHGVNESEGDAPWRETLDAQLLKAGYPGLEQVEVIAPKYPHTLNGFDKALPLPKVTIDSLSGDAAKRNRQEFERRVGAIEVRLGRHESSSSLVAGDGLVNAALATPIFGQARKYISDSRVRAAALTQILEVLPDSGRIVIVAHSLGSVIAADLLLRLPVGLSVGGMITIGSPLGAGAFDVDTLRTSLKEPPRNLGWWVNVWNANDPVSSIRGISAVVPWVLDLRIKDDVFPRSHAADAYLEADPAVSAIGYALFGSLSKEIASTQKGIDLALDDVERLALTALRYGYLISAKLKGEQAVRFVGARRMVQATTVDRIVRRNEEAGRPIPSAVATLAFDVADPASAVPVPPPAQHASMSEVIVLCTVLAGQSVIEPYEIAVSRDVRCQAMSDLTAEMGLGSKFGRDVFEAADEAHKAVNGLSVNWLKVGVIGAGAIALVVATGGLALAAAPGLVGAAAVTSALAAFGPGGMIGGLLTAGALVSAGGGGIAYGLASPETSAEAAIAVIERQLATELLRRTCGLEKDPAVWQSLVETEIELRRQLERIDEFSDRDASRVKELKQKLLAIERALSYLIAQGLAPVVNDED